MPQKSPKPSVDKAIDLVLNFPGRKSEIKKMVGKTKNKLQEIEDSSNQYVDDAKRFIMENDMIESWNIVLRDIENNGLSSEQQLQRILRIGNQYVTLCKINLKRQESFPIFLRFSTEVMIRQRDKCT